MKKLSILAAVILLVTGSAVVPQEAACDAPEGFTCIVFSDGPVPK